MAIETDFDNWQQHLPVDDPEYNSCSPNLVQLGYYLGRRWGMTANGCYMERPITGGQQPSSHSHGAAIDRNYTNRMIAKTEIVNWLIENSKELHLQAIHDYFGCRIWRADRTPKVSEAFTLWWKDQIPSTTTGMGQPWALYFHLETNEDGWHDDRPIPTRFAEPPDPMPVPIPGDLVFTRTIKPGDQGADVAFVQTVLRAPGSVHGDKQIIVDGVYGPQTVSTMKNVQTATGLDPDGWIGPKTQAVVMKLANS